jgi:3-methyladenine DNA glycosylase/8-oxoguanine DNA glycosylase
MLEALIDRYGQRLAFDGVAISAIWTPNDVAFEDENDLRALRIGYRAKALLRFSKQFADGEVSEHSFREMDDAQLREALLLLYGVGPETARILQTEAFHRHTVFDHIAPWQQKIYSRLLYGKKKVAARRIINDVKRKYGEYSALAVHYLWEDLFWKRQSQTIGWLEAEIRL